MTVTLHLDNPKQNIEKEELDEPPRSDAKDKSDESHGGKAREGVYFTCFSEDEYQNEIQASAVFLELDPRVEVLRLSMFSCRTW